ncbi:MAG: 3-deoxy-D-manno-octulosonic acid transferase, partial [Gallionella sp.]
FGDRVIRVYLPYDYPFAVKKFIGFFRPRLGILMETEIWFNLIHFCRASDTPLVMLNARMSAKSARGYSKFSKLSRSSLGDICAIAAQSDMDATRLVNLGAKNVTVVGNLKFDIVPPNSQIVLGQMLRRKFGYSRKIFLAASTREGEEVLLLDAFLKLDMPEILMVIVPRHPQRFSEVAKLIEARKITYLNRSELVICEADGSLEQQVSQNVRLVLGDTMGEMFAYYAAADLAYIGGSLLPYGGQNLIESCAVGTPVLIGPHTYNFADATTKSVVAGAAIQVKDIAELVETLVELFDKPETLSAMKTSCWSFVAGNRGATTRSVDLIKSALLA